MFFFAFHYFTIDTKMKRAHFGDNKVNMTFAASTKMRRKCRKINSHSLSQHFNLSNSEYHVVHEKTAPAKKGPAAVPPQIGNKGTTQKLDPGSGRDAVSHDQIWKEYVKGEAKQIGEWQENWGFMAEFDPKGEKKEKRELPERVNMYSENVPNTQAGNYGSRQNTDVGATMRNLEFQFYSGHRRKKASNDLVCF